MKKLVIEVLGGVVQEVYGDDPELAVILVDWDNIEDNPAKSGAIIFHHTSPDQMPAGTKALVEREAASLC